MPAAPETNPEHASHDLFDLQRVRRALHMLTPDHQEVLVLRFGQRLSLQETATMMGKSVSAIKSLQFRAVETLRGILGDNVMEAHNG
jgi:RNA polymerase sigma-70 factor (ECF subfamily)